MAITDSSAQIVNAYAYSPYGLLGAQETINNPFTYVGRFGVMAEGHGLYYMRARYYDPEVGRFINKDPIGYAGGLNLYGYVGDNPVNVVDPLGLEPPPWNDPFWKNPLGLEPFIDLPSFDITKWSDLECSNTTSKGRISGESFLWKWHAWYARWDYYFNLYSGPYIIQAAEWNDQIYREYEDQMILYHMLFQATGDPRVLIPAFEPPVEYSLKRISIAVNLQGELVITWSRSFIVATF